jgi:ethanolamine utilization microcompartment shell protein EutS
MLNIKIINNPSKGTIRLLLRKISDDQVKEYLNSGSVNSLGLIQGQLAEIVAAADIAEKASSVQIAEIVGSCPQHITMIGVFGETSSVEESIRAVRSWLENTAENKKSF